MWARPLKDRHAHELQVLRERLTKPPRSSPRGNTSKVILTLYQKPNGSTAWVRVRGELKAHRFHRPAQAPPKPKKKHNRFHTHLTKPIAGKPRLPQGPTSACPIRHRLSHWIFDVGCWMLDVLLERSAFLENGFPKTQVTLPPLKLTPRR